MLRYLLILTLGLGTPSLYLSAASDFEEWQRQQTAGFNKSQDEFKAYLSQVDQEFSGFLKQQWKEFDSFKSGNPYKKPKLKKLPVYTPPPAPKPKPVKPSPVKPIPVKPEPVPAPLPFRPEPVKPPILVKPTLPPEPVLPPAPVIPNMLQARFDFFGASVAVPYDRGLNKRFTSYRINHEEISRYWESIAATNNAPTLEQLKKIKSSMNLNGWSYAVLVNHFVSRIHNSSENERKILTWMLLLKSGYKARIAFTNAPNAIHLLLPLDQTVFAATFFTYDGTKYYSVDFDGGKQPAFVGKIFSYERDYPGANRLIDVGIRQAARLPNRLITRKLSFEHNRKQYQVSVDFDANTVKLMQTYPQVDWKVFFESDVHRVAKQQLLEQLGSMIKGMQEEEAANFLIHFVQKSFKYATDQEQFGYEKPLFPEETLFYPKSDCEDRSFMYAWLVHDLLKRDVVGIKYPGHMAAAVNFRSNIKGTAIRHNGKRFVITDPTYIGANIGTEMPQFRKTNSREVIRIRR